MLSRKLCCFFLLKNHMNEEFQAEQSLAEVPDVLLCGPLYLFGDINNIDIILPVLRCI